MGQIQKDGYSFNIQDAILAQYKELIKLVINTESMDNNEKQYWFDILPSMTDEQVDRLFDILDTERKKLEELEKKYQEEIKNLNDKHLIEWQEFQTKQAKNKVQEAESQDKQNSDDILSMIDEL
ncbi:MAG: hypothetical protein PHF46_02850 [Candidatus Gracilibacteria bacterium]|nr:hypothetical protein [Candidatus Gracilibacteria bacterium]MDD3120322.1 hypothetical protein [Candidatus Gracilibacteria bacterium]MDD4530895.1 hypothetical protein [Candidatus Gracilibacteria bacterium]